MIKKQNNFKVLELGSSPKVIISKELQTKIIYLHHHVGKLEWSGVLLYKILSGDIKDPSTFIIKAEDFFLKDIGTSAYTEYTFDENDLDMFDEIPNALEMKQGHLHTHHSMDTFFSGTDMQELQDNSPNHNYYLSLIVNFDCKWCAKIAFIAEKTGSEVIFKGSEGGKEVLRLKNEQVLVTMNCIIDLEVDEIFKKRYEKIKEEKSKAINSFPNYNQYSYNNYNNWKDDKKDDSFGSEDNKQLNLKYEKYIKKDEFEENKIKEFLCKLLSLDIKQDKTLYQILTSLKDIKTNKLEEYLDSISSKIDSYYSLVFKRDFNEIEYEEVEKCLIACINLLKKVYKYLPITEYIISTLELHIGSEEEDDDLEEDINSILTK